jgi:hypothetical protein
LLPLIALIETACGPIKSTMGLVEARQAVKEAEAEGADGEALYEMTLAREYLRKANEELGYNDYYMADQLALKANELAVAALEKVLGAKVIESDDMTPIDEPDLDVLPEEGELDPERRRGDEGQDDVLEEVWAPEDEQ